MHPKEIAVRAKQRNNRAVVTNRLLNASVNLVNRRVYVCMLRFWRSTKLAEICALPGLSMTSTRWAPRHCAGLWRFCPLGSPTEEREKLN